MGLEIGKSLVWSAVFVLVILVGIVAGIFLECVDAVAVILSPLFTRRR